MTTPERRSNDQRRGAQPAAPKSADVPVTLVTIAAAVIGAALIAWGIWQIYPPATPIFAGLVLWRGAMRIARERKDKHAPSNG